MNHVTGLFLILILRHTLPFRREHPFHLIQPELEDALIMEKKNIVSGGWMMAAYWVFGGG